MPRDEDDLLDKNFPEDERRARGMKILSATAVAIVIIFILAVGYIYVSGNRPVDPNNLPLITENNPPQKSRPTDPGGMEIPHQDASVYDHLDPKQAADQPEKLLPTPEAPVTTNAATNASTQPAAPTTTAATVPEQLPGLPSNMPAADSNPQPAVVPAPTTQTAQANPAPTALPPQTPPAPAMATNQTPAVNQTADSGYRIQLGAVRDQAAADKEWARMEAKYGGDLKGLNSSFTPISLGDKGTFLRIQAGPLSKDDAEARCAKLKGENQACLIVKAAQ